MFVEKQDPEDWLLRPAKEIPAVVHIVDKGQQLANLSNIIAKENNIGEATRDVTSADKTDSKLGPGHAESETDHRDVRSVPIGSGQEGQIGLEIEEQDHPALEGPVDIQSEPEVETARAKQGEGLHEVTLWIVEFPADAGAGLGIGQELSPVDWGLYHQEPEEVDIRAQNHLAVRQ